MEKFSVAMCVYGKDNVQHFQEAVDSICNQTAMPNEIILVVDGPVPNELNQIIEKYEKNSLFRVFRLEKNMGHGNARRLALEKCQYELVALMDADDISCHDRFEKQIAVFEEQKDLAIVGGQIDEFIIDPQQPISKREVPLQDAEIKEQMKTRCPMNQVTVMFKKSAVQAAGGFIDWYCEEDYYLWLRMFLSGMTFANVSDVLVHVRVGEEMYQRRGGMKYFKSEAKLQKYMLDHKLIGLSTFIMNVMKRLILQVLLPNKVRGWVFRNFARKNVD